MKNRKKQKQHHDWFRKSKLNLVALIETFSDEEKNVMVEAWSFYYNRISLGQLPFTNRSKMRVAIGEYFDQKHVAMDMISAIDVETNILRKLRL